MHFLPLLKNSYFLNYNNFQILVLFGVLTSDSIVRYFVNVFGTQAGFVK